METLNVSLDHDLKDSQINDLLTFYIKAHEYKKGNTNVKTAADFQIVDYLIERKGPQDVRILVGYNLKVSSTVTGTVEENRT